MTLAYWCVLIAALLPYLLVSAAKFAGGRYDNHAPREFLDKQDGWRKRASWAQLNSFEAFPPFAAAVIIAHQLQADQATVDIIALGFVICRGLYGICYIFDKATPRSLVWALGMGCTVALFIVAA